MRIYVATKWQNRPRAIYIATWLESVGHTITHKWWEVEQENEEQAKLDMEGVLSADALVLIVETDLPYCGAMTEFGMALAAGIPVYVLGHALDEKNIFLRLPAPQIQRGIAPLIYKGYVPT